MQSPATLGYYSLRGVDSEKKQISVENELLGACLFCKKRTDQKAPMHTRVKLRCQDLPPDRLAMLGSHLDII